MIFRGSIFGSIRRSGLLRNANRIHGSVSVSFDGSLATPISSHALPGLVKNFNIGTHLELPIIETLGAKFGLSRSPETAFSPYALCFKSYIHSGKQAEVEAGRTDASSGFFQGLQAEAGRTPRPAQGLQSEAQRGGMPPRSMDYVQGLLQENGRDVGPRRPFSQRNFEANADIVHMKLMRNNAFITVTDSKGNKKLGISAGKVAGKGEKLARYSAEAAAEDIGRKVRQMRTKSVVVKVNGFTFFRKKKQAILSFKDGFTNSRGDVNPVVYIEDTTRKPHNGCRRRKQRRI